MIATTPALTIQPRGAETLESAFADLDFRRDYSTYDSTHMLDELRAAVTYTPGASSDMRGVSSFG